MAEIIASLVPGQYPTGQTLTVKFPPGSRKAIVTRTDKAPVLSEVLAYDKGTIPPGSAIVDRPFISVTQDGRGNVVYDGGFPKFYNYELWVPTQSWPATIPDTFAKLTPASKYMYNAFNFCANKRKVANGNKRVLLIGDTYPTEDYNVDGSHYNPKPGQLAFNEPYGFRDAFRAIALAGGWDLTVKDMTGVVGRLNISYEELDTYALVVYISTQVESVPSSRISDELVNNLATLRLTGNGLIIITDDSRNGNYTSVADAAARGSGFLVGANKMAAPYGCYFSGNVNRQPVLVGDIRRDLGLPGPPANHPLLENLTDNEYIMAGGSESITYPELFTNELVPVDQDLVVPMTTAGTYYVNVLVQLESGDIITKPMRFIMIDPSSYVLQNSIKQDIGTIDITYKSVFDYTFKNTVTPDETLRGEILRNNVIQGYFVASKNNVTYYPFSGSSIPMAVDDEVGFNITQPFEFYMKTKVVLQGRDTLFQKSGSVGTFLGSLKDIAMYKDVTSKVAFDDIIRTGNFGYMSPSAQALNTNFNWFEQMRRARAPLIDNLPLAQCNLHVSPDPATWATTKPASPTGAAAIIASTNDVYYFCELCLDWRLHTQKANVLFGLGRNVVDPVSKQKWVINSANTTKVA